MAVTVNRMHPRAVGRFHAFLVGATVPLFLGAWLTDDAYWSSHQIEWSNFASWLIIGGMVFGTGALLCAVIDLLRAGARGRGSLILTVVLLALWLTGFFDALIHSRDAWAVMPTGLVLSCIAALLACVAAWIAFSQLRSSAAGDVP